jgi:peptidyl-prolyl cis-trans isomerase C
MRFVNAVWIASFLLALAPVGCRKASVLAKVNGQEITQEQFDAFLKFKRIPAEDEKRRERALEEYLERASLADAIDREPVLDRAALQAELDESRKETLISRYFDQFLRDKVTDESVKNYYDVHSADYEQKQVHAAHVLIRLNQGMSEAERKAKLTTAQEVYSKLQAGQEFAELADAYSEDRVSGKKAGDLGWIKEGSIDPQFSKRAFELKAGAFTEPFETPFGFHIVKVLEEPKVVKRTFQSVAGDIRYLLREQIKRAEIERLKGKGRVQRSGAYDLAKSTAKFGMSVGIPASMPPTVPIMSAQTAGAMPGHLGVAMPGQAAGAVQPPEGSLGEPMAARPDLAAHAGHTDAVLAAAKAGSVPSAAGSVPSGAASAPGAARVIAGPRVGAANSATTKEIDPRGGKTPGRGQAAH